MSTSAYDVFPGIAVTLTATANQDVGPTPYFIEIFDQTTDTLIVDCGSGTTCSGSTSQSSTTTHGFAAYVASYSTTEPPPNIQASSAVTAVTWAYQVSLSASPTGLAPGGTSTLTATTDGNVGPTPYYIEIYDATTGTWLATCAVGSTCSTSVTYSSPTSQTYIAYISSNSTAYPPPGIQATSNSQPVTWFSISLAAARVYPNTYVSDTLTATTNGDVGYTPYFIEIFDATTGTLEGYCGSGTSCAVDVTSSTPTQHNFVAYVSSFGTSNPPPFVIATSPTVSVTWVTLTLSASSGQYVGVGTAVTLTANISINVGPTPYYLSIFANNSLLFACGTGTSCATNVSYSAATSETFIATLSYSSSSYPPNGFQAQSQTVQITWVSVSLAAYPTQLSQGGSTTLTATSSIDVGPTPYYIEIFWVDGASELASCGSGTSCAVNFTVYGAGTEHFEAYVGSYDSNGSYPPPGQLTASNVAPVSWFIPAFGTGVYGFESRAQADTALNEGWLGLAPTDGHCTDTFD